MNLNINLKTLNQLTIIYVGLPLLIFLISWLKPYIAVISFVLLIYAIYLGYFKNEQFKLFDFINDRNFVYIILLFAFLWCYFAGLGGFWYQSWDHNWRNAIFRDLINYSWPLYYKTIDAAMVYYMGYWLPSAVFAKIFLFVSSAFSFFIGNVFLLLYSVVGVFLLFAHILKAVEVKSCFKAISVILFIVLFSGMDIVGVQLPGAYKYMWHIEWWAAYAQFSSLTTVLFWVFNQGLPAWLLTMLFYNNKNKVENFGLIAILCFFCSPLPFMGLSVFLIVYTIKNLIDEYIKKQLKNYIFKVFSFQNIIAVFCITPIVALYFLSNHSTAANGVIGSMTSHYNLLFMSIMVIFFMLEAGVYLILLFIQYKKDLMYYIVFISLMLCPFIKVGYNADFCMRASIPALLILAIMIIKFLFNENNFKKYKIIYIILCLCLVLGSVTPIIEFARGINDVVKNKSVFRSADNVKTLEGNIGYDSDGFFHNGNFVTTYPENKPFFKYLAKSNK